VTLEKTGRKAAGLSLTEYSPAFTPMPETSPPAFPYRQGRRASRSPSEAKQRAAAIGASLPAGQLSFWASCLAACFGAGSTVPTELPDQKIKTDGATIHVRIGGEGPAVVMLHGFADTGDMWAPLAAALVHDHTVIVPDLRGMGLCSHPEGGYDKKTQADDIARVLDSLKIQKTDLVTHDIGNMVGCAFAAKYPDRVTRWAALDAPLPGIGTWDGISISGALTSNVWSKAEDDFEPPSQQHSHNGDASLAPSLQRDFHFTFGFAQHRPQLAVSRRGADVSLDRENCVQHGPCHVAYACGHHRSGASTAAGCDRAFHQSGVLVMSAS
jgi:pimeloyl-ACP methyl ester carboxylesterase